MNVDLYTNKGRKSQKKIKLDPEVFEVELNENLLAYAVSVYLANQRQSNAHAKDRSEVRGGGKKPWKQKGTGRARHGSIRSPIWRGGGVTFGPRNERNYKKSFNKKTRKQAIRNAFTKMGKEKQIKVIDDLKTEKTKELSQILKNLKIEGKVSFIQVEDDGLYKSTRNMTDVNVTRVGELNVFSLLNGGNIVIFKSALDKISDFWGKKKSAKKIDKKEKKSKSKKSVLSKSKGKSKKVKK